jgi:diguanylate cyclase (GGDEF)-like protein
VGIGTVLLSVLEVFPDVLLRLNSRGQILDYKAPLDSELYLAQEEWHGKRLRDLLPLQVSAAFERTLNQVFRTQTTEQIEYSLLMGDTKAYYEARVIPCKDEAFALIRNITERQQREERLRHNAFHDGLTGLPNRSLFIDRLEMALRRFRRFPKLYFAVFFIDLDSFKRVNDVYGHDVGDQLLTVVAQILQSCVRANDTVARLGGDEFTILLDSITNIAEVRNVAERIQEKLNAPLTLSSQVILSGASIGIVVSTFGYKEALDLLKDADTALYQAKQNGKGQYAVFEP